MVLILIRYGEMGLKSRSVRARFESIFKENIKDYFVQNNIECIVSSDWGRIYLRTDKEKESIDILRHIFGIVSLSPVVENTSILEDICSCAVDISKNVVGPNQSFAIRARRTGDHKYTSIQVAEKVGEAVLEANKDRGIHVNLTKPDIEISIEIRKNHSYIYYQTIKCSGGMPLGTQGKVVSVFNDDYPASVAAAWLLMKRGCKTHIVCDNDKNPWIDELRKWDIHLHVQVDSSDGWDKAVVIAKKISADGFVTAENIGAIGTTVAKNAGLPLFYPVFGLSEEEIQIVLKNVKI